MKKIFNFKNIYIFIIFGSIYLNIEIAFRAFKNIDIFGFSLIGYTSLWLFFVGGLSAFLVGLLNEFKKCNIIKQCIIGALIITLLELLSGLLFNKVLFIDNPLWTYDDIPFNYKGVICLPYTIIWAFICPFIIKMDDFLRTYLWK